MKKNFSRKTIYQNFIRHIPKQRYLNVLFLLKIALLILGIISPLFYKLFVDNILINKEILLLIPVICGYVAVFVIETLILAINRVVTNKCFYPFCARLRIDILKKYTQMPAKKYDKYDTGDLDNRLQSDVNACQHFFTGQVIDYLYNWGIVIVYGVILLFMSWQLAIFGFLMIPVSFLFTKVLAKKSGSVSEKYRSKWGEYEGFVHSSLQNWREIKALSAKEEESKKFTSIWDVLSKLFVKQQIYWYLNRGFIAFKDLFVTKMNLYFIGGLLIFADKMSVGDLLVFMVYYEVMFKSIGAINEADIQLASQKPAMDRVTEILESKAPDKNAVRLKDFKCLDIKNVSFAYADKPVLKNINFNVVKGERIAVAGRSGSGKTTLAKMILGIYPPDSGEITVNGINIFQIDKISFHRTFGIVMQEPYLFNLSIRENLTLAKKSAENCDLDRVCKQAYIYNFIKGLPDGYDTIIGERGIKLSGGQKQRLAIARALLTDTPVIIFDEATSALDYEAEKFVQAALDNVAETKTVITIAHRLSTILYAQRVIVMDCTAAEPDLSESIAGDGTHDELRQSCHIYNELFPIQ